MLKEACKAAYEGPSATDGKIAVTSGSETKNYDEGQLWMLCSPLGEKPTTIKEEKEESTYTNKKASGKESDLISVKKGKNEMFWHARNGEFYGRDGFEKIAVDSSHTHFHNEQSKGDKGKTIMELCKEAYEMASNGEGSAQSPTQEQIVKYCSVDLKGTTTTTPAK